MLNVADVASYQDGIDLTQVAADAVIIKATDGTNYVNPSCNAQYASAKIGNKLIGLYHFAEPGSDATTQASYFVNNVRNYLIDEHALPYLDWEADAVNLGPAWAEAFLDTVANLTGATPMIYMSKAVANQYDWSSVAAKYGLWGAQYATTMPQYGFIADPWTDDNAWGAWGVPTIFQYSSTGHLSGWDGNLDLSLAYLDADGWKKFTNAGGNGQKVDPTPTPTPAPEFKQATINGIFVADQMVMYGGRWYAVNNDISIHPIDYNNWIPVGPLTITDGYGNRASDQNSMSDGAFFTFGDNVEDTYFDVRYLDNHSVCLALEGEPVWLNRDSLGTALKLK